MMLVEPDPGRGASFQRLASEAGLETKWFRSGKEALAALRQQPPDLLITELAVPQVDGFALLAAASQLRPRPKILVISAFLAMRDEATKRRAELGIDALLPSSAPLATVSKAIARMFSPGAPPVPQPPPLPLPSLDPKRLQAVRATGLVNDAPPDAKLQGMVQQVAERFMMPMALVSFVLEDRQWFRAHFGLSGKLLEARGTPLSQSFCRHAVDANAPLVVPDATTNPAFAQNPLVTSGAVRGYAGVPLTTSSGVVLGSLCVLDTQPIALTAEDVDSLMLSARRIAGELDLAMSATPQRKEVERLLPLVSHEGALAILEAVFSSLDIGVVLFSEDRKVLYANEAAAQMAGLRRAEVLAMNRSQWVEQNATLFDDPDDFRRKLAVLPTGPFAACEEFTVQRPRERTIRWTARPVPLGKSVAQLALYRDVSRTAPAETDGTVELKDLLTR